MSRRGTVRRRCKVCGSKVSSETLLCPKGHDKWAWSFTVDIAPAGAARKQVTRSGFPSKAAATEALTRLLGEHDRGEFVEPSRMTVEEFFTERWLPAMQGRVEPSTFAGYSSAVRLRVLPRLGQVRLQHLDAGMLTKLYADLQADGGRSDGGDGGLSARSVRQTHTIVRKALSDAQRWGLVARNVADLADPPSAKAARAPEFSAWSAEELRTFLEFLGSDEASAVWRRLRPLYLVMATTGIRRSEACGLRWRDVDLEACRLSVVNTRKAIGYRVVEGPPKTAKSRRALSLDPTTAETLRAWRKAQLEERMAWGPAWTGSGYVFTAEDGTPIHPDRVSKVFDQAVAAAGVTPIRLHDLRHTFATIALGSGVPLKVVSERLGHSNIGITADIYQHVTEGMDRQAADKVAGAIFGP